MRFWIGAFATLTLAARLQGQAAPTPPPLKQITPRPVPQVVYQSIWFRRAMRWHWESRCSKATSTCSWPFPTR